MYEYLYYLTLPFIIAGASCMSLYILYPNESKQYLMSATWKLSKFIVDCNETKEQLDDKIKQLKNNIFDCEETDELSDDDEYDEIIVYNHNTKQTFSFDVESIEEKVNLEDNENTKLVLYHYNLEELNKLYVRLNSLDDITKIKNDEFNDVNILEKQFIQVEYITEDEEGNENILDIHNNLGSFYIEGNIILDKFFLEWYLETFYNIDFNENYKLRFFDKDVNMFTLTNDNAIIFSDNTYSRIDIEDDTFIFRDNCYEGAEEE